MRITIRASVNCDWKSQGRVCSELGVYQKFFDGTYGNFEEEAREDLRKRGWNIPEYRGPGCNLCPAHNEEWE
jgi:hypothetical protein